MTVPKSNATITISKVSAATGLGFVRIEIRSPTEIITVRMAPGEFAGALFGEAFKPVVLERVTR